MPPTEEEMMEKQRKPEKKKQEISYGDDVEAMWADFGYGAEEELFDGTKTRGKKEKPHAEEDRERAKSRMIHRSLENCRFCYSNKKLRDSICWVGQHVYLALTGSEPMAEGHCIIVTKEHYRNLPSCDEDVAREILNLRRMLTGYFKAKNDTEFSNDFSSNWLMRRRGDLIVTATDGLFDNVPDEVLLQELSYLPHADQIHTQDLERTAKCLASRAHKNALNKSYVSPSALAAKSAGFHYTGGKMDDVTVIVSVVSDLGTEV
ncbi:Oidioi.mRNA.OKI2018_I69.chr1.g3930.t1.cds [Oikopleura dioica]|uniref:Protein phosphatase n=1 Tax=Oikopleura dioica TaxID=34765 RepID=A0ABN7T4V0_OIKDI|nr:Oidioi.mRNA.OKI2018_I69.chr1.g3930.t1.cds [Oikopleura dioica]